MKTFAAALLAAFASIQAAQAEPHREWSIPLDWALEAATVASETCADMGFATTVTVVDQRAQPRVQLMRENAFPHSFETSARKARTAASRREATVLIEAENAHEPTLGGVFNEIGLITLSGGVPILYDGQVIGGIGVGGAPGEAMSGEEHDDICAKAGIAAIAEKLR
ncbi:MAG: heme-binding protein [Pseudomonadota bacterium]